MRIKDKDIFVQELKEVITECENELQSTKFGFPDDCTVEDIENIILPELYHYLFLYLYYPVATASYSPKDQIECAKLFEGKSINSRMATLILQLAEKYN